MYFIKNSSLIIHTMIREKVQMMMKINNLKQSMKLIDVLVFNQRENSLSLLKKKSNSLMSIQKRKKQNCAKIFN